jgi:hypothetical protein
MLKQHNFVVKRHLRRPSAESGGGIDARTRPLPAIQVLDLLLKFFGDGERWIKGRESDRRGNRCLLGALDFVGSHHAIKADAAERYLAAEISVSGDSSGDVGDCARFRAGLRRAMVLEWQRTSEAVLRRDLLSDFNDGYKDFAKLRALILQARAAAAKDTARPTASCPRLGIEADEIVMA